MTEYKQTDYPEIIHSAGCGVVSQAIVLSMVNPSATPEVIGDWMMERGWFTENGSDWNGTAASFTNFGGGCPGKEPSWNMYGSDDPETVARFQNHIKSGYCGILLMGCGMWSRSGHFIAIVGYDQATDMYLVSDPVRYSGRDGWHSWSDFQNQVKFCYRSTTARWQTGKADEYTFRADGVIGGSKGTHVEFWQRMLCGLGFYNGVIDGIAGQQTVLAIRAYQKAYGLINDGSLGEKTAASIMQGIPRDGMTFTLRQCKYQAHSADVRVEQLLLKSYGLYKSYDIDLDFGQGTLRAVTEYQTANQLVVDGVCGPGTYRSQIKL